MRSSLAGHKRADAFRDEYLTGLGARTYAGGKLDGGAEQLFLLGHRLLSHS
jgi:hypothetical protein